MDRALALREFSDKLAANNTSDLPKLLIHIIAMSDQLEMFRLGTAILTQYLPIFAANAMRTGVCIGSLASLHRAFLDHVNLKESAGSIFENTSSFPYCRWADASFYSARVYLMHAKSHWSSPPRFLTGVCSSLLEYINSRIVNVWESDCLLGATANGILSGQLDELFWSADIVSGQSPSEYLVSHGVSDHCAAPAIRHREWSLIHDHLCKSQQCHLQMPDIDNIYSVWKKSSFTPLV